MKLSPDSVYTSFEARDLYRTHQVRLAALSCSGVSTMASIIALHWFCRMDKLFRHRLIMLLIYGDLIRSIWYFVFAAYSLARGTVGTESGFCQSSGFLIQYGTETSDYAVLVISIHSALQVFRPATRGTSDGLYKYRHYVYSGAFLLPSMMASLAFINPEAGYLSQGAYCTLPLRPFWYRLALAWIPRYLIIFIIFGLAGAIYAYVGLEFRSYANLSQSISTPVNTTWALSQIDGDVEAVADTLRPNTTKQVPNFTRRTSSIAHDVVSAQGRGSVIAFVPITYSTDDMLRGSEVSTKPLPGNSTPFPLKHTTSHRPSLFAIPSGYAVKPSSSTTNLHGPLSPLDLHQNDPISSTPLEATIQEPSSREETSSTTSPTQRYFKRRRRSMHRQLRLMFIYPLVYTLMWLIPFVYHCMNYSEHWVNHPIWFFRMGTTLCFTSMGFVDCLIFSVREKPWRTISTSDGTIWGSFTLWRSLHESNTGLDTVSEEGRSRSGSGSRRTGLKRSMTGSKRVAWVRNSIRTSASDDSTRMASGQARTRLDLEREERLAALQATIEKRRAEGDGSGGSNFSRVGEGEMQ